MRPTSHSDGGPPAAGEDDPRIAAAFRLLHHRNGWSLTAFWAFVGSLACWLVSENASAVGTPAPTWWTGVIFGAAALTVISLVVVGVYSQLLRRLPTQVLDEATAAHRRHLTRVRAHLYPPLGRFRWMLAWVGMALALLVAVICFPLLVDGIGYLAGAGKHATFTGQSYEQICRNFTNCQTETEGILTNGGRSVGAMWPAQVPLGQPFTVREAVWNWGAGSVLISSDGYAVGAILISLLLDGFGVLVLVTGVRLVRNWDWHRLSLRAWLLPIGMFAALVAIVVICLKFLSEDGGSDLNQVSRTTTAAFGSAITLGGTLDGEQVTVTAVRVINSATSSDPDFPPLPGERYYAVQFRLDDTGSMTYSPEANFEATVIDSAGKSYTPDLLETVSGCPAFPDTDNISPGSSSTGCVVFDLPTAVVVKKIQYVPDGGYSPQTGQWTVGG